MDRIKVVFSNLATVGYDADKKLLEVEFLDGTIYQYSNVPISVYNGLMKAPSHGKYFYMNVQRASFSYRRIR